ncbi:MAG: polyketide cyclase / dehydrase and lipid transport, partial [Mycobacterium sp.]
SGAAAHQLAKMNLAKMNHQRRVAGKNMAFEVKRRLEATRPVGVSRLA